MIWIKLGFLDESDCDFSKYNHDIGLYRAIQNKNIVYIGKATELFNGGFRKRLRDYTRLSDSARNYPSGILMNQNKNNIVIEILIFDRCETNISIIEDKETEIIALIQPIWNMLDS
jgi:hypothetical protein